MSNLVLKRKVKQLHKALDDENISWGELAELDSIAEQLGVPNVEDMMCVDVLIAVEEKLSLAR